MFNTLKNTVQKLLITPINKKQSPVLEIWDLHVDHRENPSEDRHWTDTAHFHNYPGRGSNSKYLLPYTLK